MYNWITPAVDLRSRIDVKISVMFADTLLVLLESITIYSSSVSGTGARPTGSSCEFKPSSSPAVIKGSPRRILTATVISLEREAVYESASS